MSAPVYLPLNMDTWQYCSLPTRAAVPGAQAATGAPARARLPPEEATLQCCSLPTGTDATGAQMSVLQFAHRNGCNWGPDVCAAAAERGNLSILKWLRQHGCPWDARVSNGAAMCNQFELFRWARQQQPPCPLWQPWECYDLRMLEAGPGFLVYLLQQQAHLPVNKLARAHAAATRMTYAVLSLKAALPDRTPHEIVLNIVKLAFD